VNYRKPIHELTSPFDVIARVRAACTRRAVRLAEKVVDTDPFFNGNIDFAVSCIDTPFQFVIDAGEDAIHIEYACPTGCGATIFDCNCDSDYKNSLHFGRR
jgi:hypothetical protein